MLSKQLNLEAFSEPSGLVSPNVIDAVEKLSQSASTETRGAIFTRLEVVEFILDLVGYTIDQPLHQKRVLEPSFGGGDFLIPVVSRLLEAWRKAGEPGRITTVLGKAICAVELHRDTHNETKSKVIKFLRVQGITEEVATSLVDGWLFQGDFLLIPIEGQFDYVVGNPPYVRQELIPAPLLLEYRALYKTMYDRADLYIPFIERSLSKLSLKGVLGFICADRWMKNKYGGPLRELISKNYRLKIYVDMVGTPSFHSDVSAYPAITVLSRETPGPTRIAHRPSVDRNALAYLANELLAPAVSEDTATVREIAKVADRREPWLLDTPDQTALIRRLEKEFPCLEDVGCKVGIGVATGADKAFIGNYVDLDVEEDRKLPLATTKDTSSGEIRWGGKGVINPYSEDGGLVDLSDFPRLSKYLNDRRELIAKRHCAKKSPKNWFRTIDRITPELARKPKLLIPDIKGEANIVFESGELYPHHNLYYITSETWDLRALQAVLLSEITRLFISTYSTKMRGGFLRFQAQYLRRIRVPNWDDINAKMRKELCEAGLSLDLDLCNKAAFKLFKLSSEERAILGGNGD